MNLDYEMKSIIDRYGWWSILRVFDLTKYSKYWNDTAQEAIGGPIHTYRDIMFKVRRVERIGGDAEDFFTRQMFTDKYTVIYFVISNIRPKKEDQIIEITPTDSRLSVPPKYVKPFEVYDILHVESKIEEGLIFSKCYCEKMTPKNDETLSKPLRPKVMNI